MYRVELKVFLTSTKYPLLMASVPNVPCGVERKSIKALSIKHLTVPNVPCGVERKRHGLKPKDAMLEFLMYRVELKEHKLTQTTGKVLVPNVPCGVESSLKSLSVVD